MFAPMPPGNTKEWEVIDDNDGSANTASVAREGEAHSDFHEEHDALGDQRGNQGDVHGDIDDAAEQNRQDLGVSGSSQ